jgi:two-component system response regulator
MTTLRRRRILLVDDDPAGAELTVAALTMLDSEASVEVVADGEEALDFLFRRGAFAASADDALPGAMLLDLKMPKIDGHEVLRQVRADPRLNGLKVIVLTSSDQARDRVLSRELGSDGYLVKPPSIAGLIALLRGCAELLPPAEESAT